MNDDDFFLAELGVIELPDIEAYSPTDFQRQYLTMLGEGVYNMSHESLRGKLFDLAAKHNMIPREADGTAKSDVELPFTWEHINFIEFVRQARRAGLEKRKLLTNELLKIMRPAFELVKGLKDKDEAYYIEDLDRRWNIAGNACNWEGVKRLPDRKVALTTSPIWAMLGSNELFDDGLGFDTPPFYLNGGWMFYWNTITKKEWEGLTESNGIPS